MSLQNLLDQRFLTRGNCTRLFVAHQSDAVQGAGNFAVLHEPAPDVAGEHVLGAEEDDTGVDADHVGINPVRFRIEGVDETVFAVNPRSPALVHCAQGRRGEFRGEHQ